MSNASYTPPQTFELSANRCYFSIVQISDLHLTTDATHPNWVGFDKILASIQQRTIPIDLLIVTGDLVQTIDESVYQQAFAKLDRLAIPYICIAGNHDVTQELDSHLPFEQRRHLAMSAYPCLRDKHTILTPHWQLLFCDSTVPGQVHGGFRQDTLAWLATQLEVAQKPCLLFCHHHVLPVQSAWLDGHIAKNYLALWQVIEKFPKKLAAIFTGHVHQEQTLLYQNVAVYTAPSTSLQFLPFSDEFAIDDMAQAGYRWITLYNNAQLATGVERMDTSSLNS